MPNIFVSGQIKVGNSNTGFNITATNATGLGQGMPFVLWNSYIDWNTNFLYASGAGLQTSITNWNGVYFLTNFSQATYFKSATRQVTNYGAYWGGIGGGQALTFSNAFGPSSLISPYTNVNVGAYAASNTVPTWTFGTNTLWTFQTFGSATNAAGLTNYESALITSNGVAFNVVCDATTNLTWTQIPSTTFNTNKLVASGSAIPLTTTAVSNVTSITLPFNGTWIVSGKVNFSTSTATTTGTAGAITLTSATLPSDGSETYSGVQVTLVSENDSLTPEAVPIVVTTGTTNVFLVARCTFSAGSVTAYGALRASLIK